MQPSDPNHPDAPDVSYTSEHVIAALARPRWLSVIAITAVVMGVLFGCCGLFGIGGLVFSRAGQDLLAHTPTGSEAAAKAQAQLLREIKALQQRTLPLTLTTQLTALAHAIALAVAGVLAYRERRLGRKLLATLCFVGIGIELINGWVGLYMASQQRGLVESTMAVSLAAQEPGGAAHGRGGGDPREVVKFMSAAMNVGAWLMVIGLGLAKVGCYIAAGVYLRRSEVIAFFDARAAVAA